jgi:hypothetical protein
MTLPTTSATLERVDAMADAVADPQHRAMLRVWRDHFFGELVGDLDLTMSTMPDNPRYRTYGSQAFRSFDYDTADEARSVYEEVLKVGLVPGCALEDERWSFGSWGLHMEGTCTAVFPGAWLINYDSTLDPEGLFLVRWNGSHIFPFDTERMLMMGEIVYLADPTTVEPADASTYAQVFDTKG